MSLFKAFLVYFVRFLWVPNTGKNNSSCCVVIIPVKIIGEAVFKDM